MPSYLQRYLRNNLKHLLLLVALTLAATLLLQAADVKCPVDGSSSYFTGQSKTDVSGKLLYLYKCNLYGHEFWVVQ